MKKLIFILVLLLSACSNQTEIANVEVVENETNNEMIEDVDIDFEIEPVKSDDYTFEDVDPIQNAANEFIEVFEGPFNELKSYVEQFYAAINNGDYQEVLNSLDLITPTVNILEFEAKRIKYQEFERYYRTISDSLREMEIVDGPIRVLIGNGNPTSSFTQYKDYDTHIKTIEYALESLKVEFE